MGDDKKREHIYKVCEGISLMHLSIALRDLVKDKVITEDQAKNYKRAAQSILNMILHDVDPEHPMLFTI